MKRDFVALFAIVVVLAFVSYRYEFVATGLFERRWLRRFRDKHHVSPSVPSLDGVSITLPDSQQHRQLRLRRVCEKYRDWLNRPHYRSQRSNFYSGSLKARHCSTTECPLLVDLQRKFMFCFVQKVASTSIKALFLDGTFDDRLSSDNVTLLHRYANEHVRRVGPAFYSTQQLKKFYKAMFVRHPFERLVSVYEDKVNKEPAEREYFYSKYFRNFAKRRNITGTLSFVEFVDYLIETPRFEYDEHWQPYFERCEPCLMEYNFVGKLETASDDFDELFAKRELNDLKLKLRHLNRRDEAVTRFIEEYFIQLERNQIMSLYRIYRFDFELFGYNILNYIDTFDNVIV